MVQSKEKDEGDEEDWLVEVTPPSTEGEPPAVEAAPPKAPQPVGSCALPVPSTAPAPVPDAKTKSFSEEELQILSNIDRIAAGLEPTRDSEKVRPAQMVATLIRLLMKKGIINELEYLEELAQK